MVGFIAVKEISLSYISRRVADIIEKVGYARCIFEKNDQQPTIMDVTMEVKKHLWEELQASAKNVQTHSTKVEVENLVKPQIALESSLLVSHSRVCH